MFSRLIKTTISIILLSVVTASYAEPRVIPVSVVEAKKGTVVEEVPLSGTVVSLRTSSISPKEQGYIENLLVDEGDEVKKGDPILYFDRQLSDIETTRVSAQLSEARARVKEFKRQRDEAKELMEKNHIASTSYEAAAAEVEINMAVVERLQSELSRQKLISERHTLYAPFDGVITEKMVEVGQWVDTNTAVFQLTELNPLRIEVPVPQFYFNQVNVGTSVKIKYDAIPAREFHAQVTTKVPVSNQNTRTFPVMIKVDNSDKFITPGMSARVFITISETDLEQSMLLPRDAIIQKPDGSKTVWAVEHKEGINTVNPIDVKTGKSYLDQIEIILGDIKEGDQIVVKGNELLQDGQTVNIIEALDYSL